MKRQQLVHWGKRLCACLWVSLLLLCAAAVVSCSTPREIRILHVNDFHGFALPYKPFKSNELQGGLAFLAGRAEELRSEKPTLLLAAGDMIQGSNWANLFQGKSSIAAMNAMRFDAMVVGNHEFDFGQTILKERVGEADFPVLGANVIGLGGLSPYVIKELNGLSVAVIGVVTGDTPVTTHPGNVTGLQILPPDEVVRKYVRDLRGENDVVIVLSHAGFSADSELAEKVDGIDAIIGGHSHTKVDKAARIGKTYVAQAFEHGLALGVLDLTVENGRVVRADSRLEPIKPTGKENKTVAAIVAAYQQRMDAVMNDTVGEALVDLDGANVRLQETNLGNWIADIIRMTAGADAAIVNGGSIRTSIRKGPVKVSDVHNVVPFDNYIVAVKLTGRQIRDALEHGVAAVENREGRFPQVSGLAFTYDRSGPKGSRVREVSIGGNPLVADREYTVATNDFLAAGGDGYQAFGDAVKSSKGYAVIGGAMKGDRLAYSDSGKWLRDIVVDYLKAQQGIAPRVEGRIREIR
jgi:2',3'-cyclic-nucleotide 2'-phosphodiesterase (5'-nucleotidase family)